MRKSAVFSLILTATVMAASGVWAGDIGSVVNNQAAKQSFQLISVDDLAKLMANPKSHVHIYDANVQGVRDSQGMVPGARPLSSDDHYDVAEELPGNKRAMLVFYCANVQCMASHEAAERACEAGYTNVSVMSGGIAGWRDAGKPVELPGGGTFGSM